MTFGHFGSSVEGCSAPGVTLPLYPPGCSVACLGGVQHAVRAWLRKLQQLPPRLGARTRTSTTYIRLEHMIPGMRGSEAYKELHNAASQVIWGG